MDGIVRRAVVIVVCGLALGACEKANDAGNDSMSAGHGGISAGALSPPDTGKTVASAVIASAVSAASARQ